MRERCCVHCALKSLEQGHMPAAHSHITPPRNIWKHQHSVNKQTPSFQFYGKKMR